MPFESNHDIVQQWLIYAKSDLALLLLLIDAVEISRRS
jgi:hypothetical protein